MRRSRVGYGAILAAALLASCDGTDMGPATPDFAQNDPLGEWKLVSIERNDGASTVVTEPERYTLGLGLDGTATVRADCNRCTGAFVTEGATLSIGPLACTLAACGPDSLGNALVTALGAVSSFRRQGALLELRSDSGLLRFEMP